MEKRKPFEQMEKLFSFRNSLNNNALLLMRVKKQDTQSDVSCFVAGGGFEPPTSGL